MLIPFMLTSLVNTFRPYLRSHVMKAIASWEFMFVNSTVKNIIKPPPVEEA